MNENTLYEREVCKAIRKNMSRRQSKWVKGIPIRYNDSVYLIDPKSVTIDKGKLMVPADGLVEVDPDTVCHPTGMYDDKKNMIYENDFICFTEEIEVGDNTAEVLNSASVAYNAGICYLENIKYEDGIFEEFDDAVNAYITIADLKPSIVNNRFDSVDVSDMVTNIKYLISKIEKGDHCIPDSMIKELKDALKEHKPKERVAGKDGSE